MNWINSCISQEEKANAEKKLRALRSDVDDRDTTITLLTEELNDTRAAVEALEEELTEWRSKQVSRTNEKLHLNSIPFNGFGMSLQCPPQISVY